MDITEPGADDSCMDKTSEQARMESLARARVTSAKARAIIERRLATGDYRKVEDVARAR